LIANRGSPNCSLACDVNQFPSVKTERLLSVLAGLGYVTVRQKGSHRQMYCEASGKRITVSAHDGRELSPTVVKKILVKDVGLSEEEALDELSGKRRLR
jgi:predicted RNA binding protein YcfA (HicA-like mRNA interferase family)